MFRIINSAYCDEFIEALIILLNNHFIEIIKLVYINCYFNFKMNDIRKLIALKLNALDLFNFIHVNKCKDYDLHFWKQLFEKHNLYCNQICCNINEWLKLYDRSLWAIEIQKDICIQLDYKKLVSFDVLKNIKFKEIDIKNGAISLLYTDNTYKITFHEDYNRVDEVIVNKLQLKHFLYYAYQQYVFECYYIIYLKN